MRLWGVNIVSALRPSLLWCKTSSFFLNYPVGILVTDMTALSSAHLKKKKNNSNENIHCHCRNKLTKLMSWRCRGSVTSMEGAAALHWAVQNSQSTKQHSPARTARAAGSLNTVCTDDESPAEAGDQWTGVTDINTLKDTLLDDHLYWPLLCRRHITGKLGRAVEHCLSRFACSTGKQGVLVSCLKPATAASLGALAFSVGNPGDKLSKQKSLVQTSELRKWR